MEAACLHFSSNIIRVSGSRRMRWAEHVAPKLERRSEYRVLVGKTEGRRLLRRPRCMWEDNIKIDLK